MGIVFDKFYDFSNKEFVKLNTYCEVSMIYLNGKIDVTICTSCILQYYN